VPQYADSEEEIAMIHVDHRDLPRDEFERVGGREMQFNLVMEERAAFRRPGAKVDLCVSTTVSIKGNDGSSKLKVACIFSPS
jgi:hypothetical protein